MPGKKLHTEHCKNCNYDFRIDLPNMKYCPNCGQENHSPRMPFFHYLYELIEGIFHLDNKTWLTIKTLFLHPGMITKNFIEDKRNRYSPPVRMYIWCTALFMFSFWLLMDTISHKLEPVSKANRSMSQRFDDLADTSSSAIRILTSAFWPTLPSTPILKQRELKYIPDHKIKDWLKEQNYPADYFHIQLIKAYRSQCNSQLTLSAFTKKVTAGNNLIFILLLPFNALLLFPVLYRKKFFYYDSMIFTVHINTWIPLFQSVWIWVLAIMLVCLDLPELIFLSIPLINAIYYLIALKNAFSYSWTATIARGFPAFIIDTLYHWIIMLSYSAWFMN
ncbi:MAG: DUF3667 domain-containing protein [Saprospiraceae bacterium]|nr:DUF3667 domain-containing protein [Saprospiraceae bacterium]